MLVYSLHATALRATVLAYGREDACLAAARPVRFLLNIPSNKQLMSFHLMVVHA